MINFDVEDFSERRSEEVMFLWSVILLSAKHNKLHDIVID